MKTKLFYITIFSLLFILKACKRDNPCEGMDPSDKIYTYNIPDSNKAKIPYTGTETLIFISNTGDTATLVGHGKDTYYETESKGISFGDCPRTGVYKYEHININYISNNKKLLNLKYSSYMNKIEEIPSLTSLTLYVDNNIIANSSYEFIFNGIDLPNDSIILSGIYITGQYINYGKTALFNKQIGIIKFKDIDNKIWTLIIKK